MTVNETPRDDLTMITGIGPVRQRWLRQELGVETYQDLAAFSVDELEAQLKEAGRSVSRSDIEGWIREAREKAGLEDERWKPFASFVVEYQQREEGEDWRTTAHHMEEDKDASWSDIVQAELCRWMLEQAGLPVPDVEELMHAEAWERLDEELAEREAEARRQLKQELDEERARMQQSVKEELETRRTEGLRELGETLEQELAERRAQLRKEVEQAVAEERAEAEQALEEELEARRETELEAVAQEIEERRAQLRKEVEQAVAEERAKAEQALEEELEARRETELEAVAQEIEERQAQLRKEVEQAVAEERAKAEQALEVELAARRDTELQAREREEEKMPPEAVEAGEAKPLEEPALAPSEFEAEPEGTPPFSPVAIEKAVALTIKEIKGYQPPYTAEPRTIEGSESAPALLKHDSPFALTVFFRLDEVDATALAERRATYTVQIHARDLSTGKTWQLGRTRPGRFVEGQTSYTDTLSALELAAGLYRLTFLVISETSPPGAGYDVVPMLLVA